MSKITVVTITFNLIKNGRRDYFIQNMESVHNQTYKNIEHIVIDGASTDGTVDLLKEYQAKGYIKFWSEPDTGIYDAMNKGIQHATGDYITYLNSDDFYHDSRALDIVANALKKSDADFLSGNARIVHEDGSICYIMNTKHEEFFVRMPFCHQSLFVKKDLMEKLGGFDTNFKSAGDYDFVIRMFLAKAHGIEIPYNISSFRLGGFSNAQVEISHKETFLLLEKNFSGFVNKKFNWQEVYIKHLVPRELFEQLKLHVSHDLAKKMDVLWAKSKQCDRNTKFIKMGMISSSNQYFVLLNLIPVIKISMAFAKTKIYLFGLPLLYIKKTNNSEIYRFFGIPVFVIKHELYRTKYSLWKIPVLVHKH